MWKQLGIAEGEVKIAIFVFILTALFLYIKKEYRKKKYNVPPGPIGIPYFGYIPFLGVKPHKTLNHLRSKYGNVIGLYLGQKYTVVLNDITSIKEAFSKSDFSGRPHGVFKFTDIYDNIVNMTGKMWHEHMRFHKSILRDLGMGKGKVEEIIMYELSLTMAKLEKIKPDEDVNIRTLLSNSIDNVIYFMICGKRYDEGDPVADILADFQNCSQRYHSSSAIHAYIPCLKSLNLLLNPSLRGVKKAINNIEDLLKEELDRHEKNHDENALSDFLDYAISEIKKRKGEGNFTKNTLNGSAQQFLLGGSETSRVTLEWGLMLLAKHPEVQERAYKEIVETFGTEKLISWDDRESIPYLNAVIYEIQRKKTIVPLNLLRSTQNDTTVGGFEIPKNTTVIANFWSVHMDPTHWNNPKDFNPERFLTNDGKHAKAHPSLIPFSYGERMCPGEKLATMQLLISFSNLIQKYKIKPPSTGLDFSGENRLVRIPKNPLVQFEKR